MILYESLNMKMPGSHFNQWTAHTTPDRVWWARNDAHSQLAHRTTTTTNKQSTKPLLLVCLFVCLILRILRISFFARLVKLKMHQENWINIHASRWKCGTNSTNTNMVCEIKWSQQFRKIEENGKECAWRIEDIWLKKGERDEVQKTATAPTNRTRNRKETATKIWCCNWI